MQAAEVLKIHDRVTLGEIAINLGSKAAHMPDSSGHTHGTTMHICHACVQLLE